MNKWNDSSSRINTQPLRGIRRIFFLSKARAREEEEEEAIGAGGREAAQGTSGTFSEVCGNGICFCARCRVTPRQCGSECWPWWCSQRRRTTPSPSCWRGSAWWCATRTRPQTPEALRLRSASPCARPTLRWHFQPSGATTTSRPRWATKPASSTSTK